MTWILNKLAKPITTLGLTAFVGQLLIICCCVGAANASANILETSEAAAPAISKPHCNNTDEALAGYDAPTLNLDIDQSHDDQNACSDIQDLTQSSDNCCNPDTDQAAVSSLKLEIKNHPKFESDGFDLLLTPVSILSSVSARTSIPLDPALECTYSLTPIYLSNCSFLE